MYCTVPDVQRLDRNLSAERLRLQEELFRLRNLRRESEARREHLVNRHARFPSPEHIMAKTTFGVVVCFNFEMERRFACLQGEDVADESTAAQG
jgi:hypothetical protein